MDTPYEARHSLPRVAISAGSSEPPLALPEGFAPRPSSATVPPPPTEPEWYDGDEVYPIYRPSPDDAGDAA
jgi:hypothetical protein